MTSSFQGTVEEVRIIRKGNLRVVKIHFEICDVFDQWLEIPSPTLNVGDPVMVTIEKKEL